jgi:hypothetical protein
MPALGLRVGPVLNLYPTVPVVLVDAHLSLGDNSLQVASAYFVKELLSGAINVLRV